PFPFSMPGLVKQTLEPFLLKLPGDRRSRNARKYLQREKLKNCPQKRGLPGGRCSVASGGLLLGRLRRRRRGTLRAARGTLFANGRQFLLALDVFVEPDGQILDNRILHAQTTFNFVDQLAVRGANLEVNVDAFAVLGDAVSKPARAPMLGLFDFAALFRAGDLDSVFGFLDFLLRRCRTNDKDQIV